MAAPPAAVLDAVARADLSDDPLVRTLLQDPELFELAYHIHHDRAQQDQWLSLESEQLIEGLAVDGLQGWGDLYGSLVGRLRPVVEGQPMGLAQADNLLAHPQRARRAAAWHAIQAAWGAEQETVAAILNAINGWRNELAAIADPASGNYAFIWDDLGRNISHARDYFIHGYDPETGEMAPPWLDTELYERWRASGLSWQAFAASVPSYEDQRLSRTPHPDPVLNIKRRPASIFDYAFEDFEIVGYESHPHIKAPVAV